MTDRFNIDGEKLSLHPERVAQWRAATTWERAKYIYPLYVEVSPAGACNHRCTFCAVDYIGYKPKLMDATIFEHAAIDMANGGVKSVMFAGEGEPLLNRHINQMVDTCAQLGIDTAFTTNAYLLDRLELRNVSWVKVSVNAGTADTYAAVHHTKAEDWVRVWSNIREAVRRKPSTCQIGVQMVVLPENQMEQSHLEALARSAGVDYCVFKPYSQHKKSITRQYEGFKPVSFYRYGKAVVRDQAFENTEHTYERCLATPSFWAYIMATGDVYTCSAYLLDERFRIGNINEESFAGIWEGERRRENWEYVRDGLDISECRVNCRMARVNEYLHALEHAPHRNFI